MHFVYWRRNGSNAAEYIKLTVIATLVQQDEASRYVGSAAQHRIPINDVFEISRKPL